MFNLDLTWDRPAKISSQVTNHVLRVRIIPQGSQQGLGMPLHLALCLDTSSSMQGEKLEQAKLACQSVVAQLRNQDSLSLSSFASRVSPLLQKARSSSANTNLDRLTADGVTRTDLALDWIQTTLPAEPGIARVGILITDGHATNNQGKILEDITPLINQATQLAAAGIVLCAVGLGNAANFNTGFLVELSDRGRGAFLYADTPAALEPLLQARLSACQAIAADAVKLKLEPATGVQIKGFCRFRPEYLPLEETAPNELTLGLLQADTPTDILIEVEIPALGFGDSAHSREVLNVQLMAPGTAPIIGQASIQYTNSFRESQQVDETVNSDRLFWEINLYTTELTRTNDPKRTGELLTNIQVAAMKSGEATIANQAAQQLETLQQSGRVNTDKTTKLLRDSRNLGGQ